MSSIELSVEDILLYCTCPLKYKMWKERPETHELTRSDLYSMAAKRAIYAYFNHLSNGGLVPTSIQKATRRFDEIWLENQYRLVPGMDTAMYNANLLATHISEMHNIRLDEVVGTQFPIHRTFGGTLLLKDSVDVLIIRRESGTRGKVTYRGIQLSDPNTSQNNRYLQFRLALFKSAMQQYLGPQTRRHYLYELRPIRGTTKISEPKPIFYHDLVRLATNVSKGIKHGVFYPTTSKEVCKECPLNRVCEMSLLK